MQSDKWGPWPERPHCAPQSLQGPDLYRPEASFGAADVSLEAQGEGVRDGERLRDGHSWQTRSDNLHRKLAALTGARGPARKHSCLHSCVFTE